jgi:hypothetical protein
MEVNDDPLARWDAEARYDALQRDLAEVERRVTKLNREAGVFEGFYLADANVDHENALDAGLEYGSVEFWDTCIRSSSSAAGSRAETSGLNVNDLLGRVIY